MRGFQVTTKYALMILNYLDTKNGELIKATQMSRELGITYDYLTQVLCIMRKKGLVASERGCQGGFRTVHSIDDITVYEVVTAIEGKFKIHDKSDSTYERKSIENYFDFVTKCIEEPLKSVTVRSLFNEEYISMNQ